MADQTLEAPNPFNQTQLQEGDSLNFESNFWKEEPIPSSAAYDDDNDNQEVIISNTNNAYDDDDPSKPNAITTLFNNISSKLKESPSNGVHGPYEVKDILPSTSESKTSNLLSTRMTHQELDKKEAYLDKREKQLLSRKRRLIAVKHELSSSNIRYDNWPCTYYPITFHSIQQEIPPHARSHMSRLYTLVLLTFLCFILNCISQLVLYFNDIVSDSSILLAVIYLFCGVCGSWRLWYRQIYYGIRDRKTIKWWCFFVFFFVHIVFCVCLSLGIEGWGGAGIITMVNAFQDKNSFSGFLCLISSCLWCINGLGSCFYMKRSWVLFKQRGGLSESKSGVANVMARHAVDQLV